jgi:hypothetical protein
MHEEPSTVIIQLYLAALPGDSATEPIIRELLERSVGRFQEAVPLFEQSLKAEALNVGWLLREPGRRRGEASGRRPPRRSRRRLLHGHAGGVQGHRPDRRPGVYVLITGELGLSVTRPVEEEEDDPALSSPAHAHGL